MAVRGGASIKITGNVTEALAALDRLGIRAAEVGAETESKLGGAAEKTGGLFGKLGNLGASFGLPFSESLSKMGEKFKDVEGHSVSFGAKLAEVGKAATLAGVAGFGVVAAESIKLGMNYQQATAQIAASSGVSTAAAKAVGDEFLKTGFKSTFSAQEIATAYGGVAGQLKATEGHALSAGDAMTVMQGAMDLAEASGQSLGSTTTALAATMQAYGLKTKDAGKAADQLYNISVLTNQPIQGLAAVLDRLKGRLGALAPSLSDVGTLMAFPSVAAQGSRGAMVVNTALTTLLGGSKNVSKELKSLGVNIFNAQGKFVGMRGVIAQLQPKLAGMTDQQRMLAEKTLFGSSAAQLLGSIIKGGVSGYDKAAASVNKLGTAHEAAEKQANTLKGQTEKLKSGLEDLGVRLGDFLIPKLLDLEKITGKVVGWMEKHKAIAVAVAAVVGGVLVAAFAAWAATLFTADGALAFLIGPLGLVAVAVAALGVAVYELYTHWSTVWDGIKSIAMDVWNDGLKPVFGWIKTIALEPMKLEIKALELVWSKTWDAINAVLNGAWNDVIKPVFGFIKTVAIEPIKLEIQGLETVWSTVWGTVRSVLNTAWSFIKQIFGFIQTVAITPIMTAVSVLGAVWSNIWSGIQTAVQDVWRIIKPIIDGIKSALGGVTGAVHDIVGGVGKVGSTIGSGLHAIGLAEGGIVTKPTLAIVGEAGYPEAVIPLKNGIGALGYNATAQPLPRSTTPAAPGSALPAGVGGGQTFNIAMNGTTTDPGAMARELAWQLRPYMNGR